MFSDRQDSDSVPCAAASPGGEEGDCDELLVKDDVVSDAAHSQRNTPV